MDLLAYHVFFSSGAYPSVRTVQFDREFSSIEGSIRYALIGRYIAAFQDFDGLFIYDSKRLTNCSVELSIPLSSIHSKYPALDRLILSKRILYAAKYPKIKFQSSRFLVKNKEIVVEGQLSLHGVKKLIEFPVDIRELRDADGTPIIIIRGSMDINRKDFDVIFNKILDHGGLIIGNSVKVEWSVIAPLE